jgi:hypothetical protein
MEGTAMNDADREFVRQTVDLAIAQSREVWREEMKTVIQDALSVHLKECMQVQEIERLKLGIKGLTVLLLAGGAAGAFGGWIKDVIQNYK